MSDADSLLLTLEVEAAAARNAELSYLLERVQGELLELRSRRSPTQLPLTHSAQLRPVGRRAASTQTANENESEGRLSLSDAAVHRSAEDAAAKDRYVVTILDDILFEVAEMYSLLYSSDAISLAHRSQRGPDDDASSVVVTCLTAVQQLKHRLAVRKDSSDVLVAELEKLLGEKVAAAEQQAALFYAEKEAWEATRAALTKRIDELASRQAASVLDSVMRGDVLREDDSCEPHQRSLSK